MTAVTRLPAPGTDSTDSAYGTFDTRVQGFPGVFLRAAFGIGLVPISLVTPTPCHSTVIGTKGVTLR